jgi:hypothetical protein
MFRVRVSTALLFLALLGLPTAAHWIPAPRLFAAGSIGGIVFGWVFYDLPVLLALAAFVAALVIIVVVAIQERWRSIPQHVVEMIVCVACVLLTPAY